MHAGIGERPCYGLLQEGPGGAHRQLPLAFNKKIRDCLPMADSTNKPGSMTEEQRIRNTIAAWDRARPVIEEQKRREIRSASTPESVRWFDSIFRKLGPDNRTSSGLLEQQRWFKEVRRRQK